MQKQIPGKARNDLPDVVIPKPKAEQGVVIPMPKGEYGVVIPKPKAEESASCQGVVIPKPNVEQGVVILHYAVNLFEVSGAWTCPSD